MFCMCVYVFTIFPTSNNGFLFKNGSLLTHPMTFISHHAFFLSLLHMLLQVLNTFIKINNGALKRLKI